MVKRGDPRWLQAGWIAALGVAAGVRIWNALFGPLFHGYDAWGHVSYIAFLDRYHALPYADQGWTYFHPPLYYALGWAVAQLSTAEGLIRCLGLLGGAASLGIAALAAWVVKRRLEGPPALPLLAFTAVAFLPVHVYTSVMPGNEMLAAFFASAALASFLLSERDDTASLGSDLRTGLLAGLAALTKLSGITVLGAIGLATLLGHVSREGSGSLGRLARRLLAIGGVALVIAGPFYLRTALEYGTPFQFSRDFPPMLEFELAQLPGERSWRDFVSISPRLFSDPASDAPHLLHSVWGNLYLNMWFDSYGASQIPLTSWDSAEPRSEALTRLFAVLGLGPTLLALFGAILSLRAVLERRSSADLALLLVTASSLLSFIVFALRVPTWAALKASYLMALSIPYAFYIARGTLGLWQRKPIAAGLAGLSVAVAAAATALVFTSGGALEMSDDKREMAGVYLLFGEYEASSSAWQLAGIQAGGRDPVLVEGLAAAELLAGNAGNARALYASMRRALQDDPYLANRLAVASALAGDVESAARLLEQDRMSSYAEMHVNRGALRLAVGDRKAAELELRRAIELAPEFGPAWTNLAHALEAQGSGKEAAAARAQALALGERAPRGFPYGVGNGDLRAVGGNQRWMLLVTADGELELYRPPRARPSQGQE